MSFMLGILTNFAAQGTSSHHQNSNSQFGSKTRHFGRDAEMTSLHILFLAQTENC